MSEFSDALPLTAGARAQWLLHRLTPGATAFHTAVAARLHGHLDRGALATATADTAARHPLIGARFSDDGGRPVCRPGVSTPTPRFHDLPVTTDAAALQVVLDDLVAEPFDLEGTGAHRVDVVTRGPHETVVLVSAHHIAADAHSDAILLRDLLVLYGRRVRARQGRPEPSPPASLPEARDGVTNAAQREERYLASERGVALARRWKQGPPPPPAASLPLDRPRPARRALRGGSHRFTIAAAVADDLRATARALSSTPYALLLGSVQALLWSYGAPREFVVGAPVTTRLGSATRDAVGNFINTVLVAAAPTGEGTLADTARAASDALRSALRDVQYPVALCRRRTSREPRDLYLVTVNMLDVAHLPEDVRDVLDPGAVDRIVDVGGVAVSALPVPQQQGQTDLAIDVIMSATGLHVELRYDDSLFDLATIEGAAACLRRILDHAATAPHTPLRELAAAESPRRPDEPVPSTPLRSVP